MTDIDRIVAGLTKAQREALMRSPCRSWWGDMPAIMPPRMPSTAEALRQKGLVIDTLHRRAFPLTPLGLAVRAALEEKNDG